ncbi:hypothetical protein [Shinella sumterensis]|uniref:Uncharacterized protein n=1 Tax=Shinella sumterensis TaxID=1967501 RepID=A0AA50HB85_9HYPH|nr:hypothetical protein [Shinella sumterensis]WLS00862.1 hypothetical protein Q9313_26180 [Shinella sumterensis]
MKSKTNLTVELLKELIPEDVKLPEPKKTSIRDLPDKERRAYKARKQAERRAVLKERAENGSVKFDAKTTREALADAAIMLLASGAPGSEAVEAYLRDVFADQIGAPLTINARVQLGQLKPKLLKHVSAARS